MARLARDVLAVLVGNREDVAPRIVGVIRNTDSVLVPDAGDVALQVLVVVVRAVVVHEAVGRAALIVQVHQLVVPRLLAVQHAAGVIVGSSNTAYRLGNTAAICGVAERHGAVDVVHRRRSAPVLPLEILVRAVVRRGVADLVVGNAVAVDGGELIFPAFVAVGVRLDDFAVFLRFGDIAVYGVAVFVHVTVRIGDLSELRKRIVLIAFLQYTVFPDRLDVAEFIVGVACCHTVGGLGGDLCTRAVGTVTSLIPVYTFLLFLSSETGRGRMFSSLAPFGDLLFSGS